MLIDDDQILKHRPSPVADLPNELLEAISVLLDDPLDVLCLAFACRTTWQASEQAIRAFVRPWQDGWRGHRIFCVADTEGATMDDAIGALELSAEEEREVREAGELYFLCYHSSYAEIDDTYGAPSIQKIAAVAQPRFESRVFS